MGGVFRRSAGVLAGLTLACSSGTEDNASFFGDGTGDGTAVDSATEPDSGSADDDDEPLFDIGNLADVPGMSCDPESDPQCHCDAVDLVFVVDNSGSMSDVRDDVVAAFPTFVGEMFDVLPPGTDLHVALTRATGFYDPGNGGGWSGPTCEAALTDGVFVPPTDGAHGENGQQGRLFEHEGMTYFAVNTNDDPAALESWFDGALTGTIDGSAMHSNTETVVAGASYVVHPANATSNSGFLRDDAVLVLFLLSDSPDLTPPEVPTSDLIQIVRDAKAPCGGDLCVVTAGAIQGQCFENPENTNTRLTEFMNGFGKPPASIISLEGGSPDFTGVLGATLADVISTTCDEIIPEG